MIYGQPICKSPSVHDKDSAETNVRIAILNKQNPAMWTGRMHDSSANPTHALDNKDVLVTVGQDSGYDSYLFISHGSLHIRYINSYR